MTFSSNFRRFLLTFSCLVLFSCGDNDSDGTNSSSNQADSNEISVGGGASEQEESGSEQPNSNEQNDSVDIDESLPNESGEAENAQDANWQEAEGWTNLRVANRLQGLVTITFDVRARNNNINGIVAVTNGPANDYDDLALIFRMFRNGLIDARDGDIYASEMELAYEVDAVYQVEMEVNFNARLYDVFVTYPSGQRFPVRLSAAFRSSQPISTANQLVIYEANNDDLEVTNFRINNDEVALYTDSGENVSTPNDNSSDSDNNENNNNGNDSSNPVVDLPPIIELDADLPRIEVNSPSELTSALGSTSGGGVIYVRSGTYGCVDLSDRNHSRQAPLLIEGLGDVVFNGNCSYTIDIEDSSYIAIRNISVTGGLDGVRVTRSDHVILDNLDISQSRQAGVHIGTNSSYVDVLNSEIHDTGTQNPQWGECVYIGTGSTQNFPDETTYVWIENNEIYNCGFAEAVNVKPEVFNTTVKGNRISDISPGSFEYTQYNQAAITVEGGRGSDPSNNHRPTQERDVWVEDNEVSNVSEGRWNNGIMIGGTGVYAISNTLRNIAENAVWVNRYGNLGLPAYVFGNSVNSSGNNIEIGSGVNVVEPQSSNPNRAQNWLPR
ncbi:MAG: hypothetical protein ACRBBR_06825 [Cellvibrionaceae bacterium]